MSRRLERGDAAQAIGRLETFVSLLGTFASNGKIEADAAEELAAMAADVMAVLAL